MEFLGLAKDGSTNYLVALCLIIILAAVYKITNRNARTITVFTAAGLALFLKIYDIVLMFL